MYGVRSGKNRYSDFVALETLLRFENCSSSHCLLSSWRRFHVFESSHPSFHRTGAPLAFLRGVAMGLCPCYVIFMLVWSGLPFVNCATCLNRYLIYRDIYFTDFTCIIYTFPFLLGTLLLCYLVTLLPCYPITLLPCYLVTLLLCYPVTLLPCYPVTFKPCYPVMLPCYFVTLLPCYLVTLLPCYFVTLLPCYLVTLLPLNPVTLLPCYPFTLLLCYLVTLLPC